MSSTYASASRGVLGAVLLGFLTVLAFPADLPQLFGPEGFGWASWCYAFGVPVLAVALWDGGPFRVRLLWPTVAFFACIAATGVFAVDAATTAFEAAKLLGLALAAFAAAWLAQSSTRLFATGVFWLAAVISVVQALAFMNHVEYGLAERITVYVLPAGWGGYPELGPLVCVQFAVCLAALITVRGRPAQVAAVALVALSAFQAAFLFSRLAWVTIGVVLVVMVPIAGLRRRALVPLAIAGVALAAIVGAAIGMSPTFRQLARGAVAGQFGGAGVVEGVTLNVANLDARASLWSRSTRMARDHWATGVGLGNFQRVYEPNYNPDPNNDGRRGVHAHNAFLQQAAELGVVGGIAFAWLWMFASFCAFRGAWSTHEFARVAIAACLVAFLVQNLGENLFSSFDGPRGRLTFVVWLTLAMASIRPSRPALASRETTATAAPSSPA